jgi:hypothetical protein
VCCWIDWLLMIKNCLIESGPPCIAISVPSRYLSYDSSFALHFVLRYKKRGIIPLFILSLFISLCTILWSFNLAIHRRGLRDSVVVEALCYKPEVRRLVIRLGEYFFFQFTCFSFHSSKLTGRFFNSGVIRLFVMPAGILRSYLSCKSASVV